jgi:hypothetical protein
MYRYRRRRVQRHRQNRRRVVAVLSTWHHASVMQSDPEQSTSSAPPEPLPAHAAQADADASAIATASGPDMQPQVKSGWRPDEPGENAGAASSEPMPTSFGARRRDGWLWVWPLVVLAAMAFASRFWGPFGVLAAGVVTVGAIALIIGGASFTPPVRLAVILVTCSLVVLIYLGQSLGVISDRPAIHATTSPAAPQGVTPSPSANVAAVDRLRRGEGKGATLGPISLDRQDLTDARLDGARALGASLVDTVLNRASLAGADLSGANMRSVHLRGANLRGANLAGVDLRDADLTDACLLGADLSGAILDRAVLSGAVVDDVRADRSALDRVVGWSTPSPAGSAACLVGS